MELSPLGQRQNKGLLFRLDLTLPAWKAWNPGQFVMVRPLRFGLELPWGRPFSICRAGRGRLTVLFQVVGRGTGLMAGLSPGEEVDVWGPLGNGFPAPDGSPVLMLAGGVGLAPFCGYAAVHPEPASLSLFFARRPPLKCYPYRQLQNKVGIFSHLQERTPADIPAIAAAVNAAVREHARKGQILACGPTPFLRTVQTAALESGAEAWLSLENRMACGVGACLGCVADTQAGKVCVCTKGPVFKAQDVNLD